MIELIGWAGGILFAICAIPQAWECYRQKHANGLSWLFLMTWLFGEVFTLIYVFVDKFSWSLIVNYVANLIALLIIIYYKGCGDGREPNTKCSNRR